MVSDNKENLESQSERWTGNCTHFIVMYVLILWCCFVVLLQLEPSLGQWTEFLIKYLLLPYQLIAEFAWDWLAVHYWTSRFVIVNTVLLSVLEGCALWRLWVGAEIRYTRVIVIV